MAGDPVVADAAPDLRVTGTELHDLVARLYPICRSITGDGVRATLDVIAESIALDVHEVPTGTPVLDWTIPQEWNVREAYLEDPSGRRVVDLADSSLHLLGYSTPVDATMSLDELRPHLHTLPEQPTLVPYRTSYYAPNWGFCLRDDVLRGLPDGRYRVVIDSTLTEGHLTYAEHVLPGQSSREVFVSCHVCHPSLANDNLAGIAVAVGLARRLAAAPRYFTYRFLFVPGTIGSITWLARNQDRTDRIAHGLVLACAGDSGALTYKRSRTGDAEIDQAVTHVLARSGREHRVRDFSPYGYDERQYCSPGFNLPVGSLTRTPHAEYPEYHTSGDDLEFVSGDAMVDTLDTCWAVCRTLERNRRYLNLSPHGEPQLGRRGLYGAIGGRSDTQARQMAMLWALNLSDGQHSLLDIAERSGVALDLLDEVAGLLCDADLLKELI